MIPYRNFLVLKVRYGEHDRSLKIFNKPREVGIQEMGGRQFLVVETEGEWTAIPIDAIRKIEATVPRGED